MSLNKDNQLSAKDKVNSDPKNIQFLRDITKESFIIPNIDNTFCIFKAINGKLNVIYSNIKNSIISFDIINNKKIIEIKDAHKRSITNFRHYLDNLNTRDLILSISSIDRNIKVWNNKNWECCGNFKNIYTKGAINSAFFLNNNNENYIVVGNNSKEKIKVIDFNEKEIKEINESEINTYFIDIYYDNKLNKNFILSGNPGFVRAYDYDENKIYHQYNEIIIKNNETEKVDDEDDECNYIDDSRFSIVVNCKEEVIELIDSCSDGNIRIYNFHSGELIKKIEASVGLYGLCLWDNNYLFVGCKDNSIKLIELDTGKIVKTLKGHNNCVITIKKIIDPKYGDYLLSQGLINDGIKLWKN